MASETTIDGNPHVGDQRAVEAAEHGADETGRHGDERHRQPRLGEEPGDHARDREDRPDRDVDLAGEDDERHPERDDEDREVREKEVAEVVAREEARRGEGEHEPERHDGERRRRLLGA